jgi:anti-sigma B factor antagonist
VAFAIEAAPDGRHVVLAVHGDVDIATAPTLRETLAQTITRYDGVVVDLEGVPFLDSTGLGVLVAAYHKAATTGCRVVLARPQRIVKNALRLVQVDAVIDVYDDLAAALAAI